MARAAGLHVVGRLPKPFAHDDFEAILHRETMAPLPQFLRKSVKLNISEADLRCAIVSKQFVLHYQPKIDIKSGAVAGVEVLVRWQHPLHGVLFPEAFLPQM